MPAAPSQHRAVIVDWPEPGIARAVMTREEEMNTLTLELLDGLERAFAEAEQGAARALIVTGSGRAFCCGAHLKSFTEPDPRIGRTRFELRDNYLARIAALFDRAEALPLPVIAAINGFALGGGCELAISCDFRLIPPRAYSERSFEVCDAWVEADLEGTIEAATIVTAAFENLPPPPYAIAYVRLDGVSTAMVNFVRGLELSDVPAAAAKLAPGTRVRAVFADKREGRVTDFHYELGG